MNISKNTIVYEDKKYEKIISKKETKDWIKKVLKKLNYNNSTLSLTYISKEKIELLNKEYFNKNYPTDVLSFSQIEGEKIDFIGSNFLGDIVICIEIANEYSKNKNHSLLNEIKFLILHGILHLLGNDHNDEDINDKMIKLQNKIFYDLTGVIIE